MSGIRSGFGGLNKLGIGGGWVLHGPTVAGLKISVKVTCHKEKINICGKSLGSRDRENVVWVRVSGCGFEDSRNGNGISRWELQECGSFPQGILQNLLVSAASCPPFREKAAKGWGTHCVVVSAI